MHIDDQTYTIDGRTYRRTLLRQSYRKDGKVKSRTLANISCCSDEEIEALKFGMKMKGDLQTLRKYADAKIQYGKKVGTVVALYQAADRLGIRKALGNSREGKLILWLIFARLIDQGSRLSATRLAQSHAACEIIGMEGFNEDDLYSAMDWLCDNQKKIEEKLFKFKQGKKAGNDGNLDASGFYLYDVSSSYLEGGRNELADWGYNRDKKRGKKQLVYGLLTDGDGDPVTVEAFRGNTADSTTVRSQVDALLNRFGCERIAFVGDKGSIKTPQMKEIQAAGFNYITSITKPQIKSLLAEGTIQMDLFDANICEVEDGEENIRYILRRNPERSEKMAETRNSKIEKIKIILRKSNEYLAKHPRSRTSTQIKYLSEHISKLKLEKILEARTVDSSRTVELLTDEEALMEAGKLDGCYIIQTDLPRKAAAGEIVHQRYKDLALVEKAFRTCKTGHLEVRPVYVRNSGRTRAHIFITMLAYKMERFFRKCWADSGLTVLECFDRLSSMTALVMTLGSSQIAKIASPDDTCDSLLKSANIIMPGALPHKEVSVVTRKTLSKSRKT